MLHNGICLIGCGRSQKVAVNRYHDVGPVHVRVLTLSAARAGGFTDSRTRTQEKKNANAPDLGNENMQIELHKRTSLYQANSLLGSCRRQQSTVTARRHNSYSWCHARHQSPAQITKISYQPAPVQLDFKALSFQLEMHLRLPAFNSSPQRFDSPAPQCLLVSIFASTRASVRGTLTSNLQYPNML